MKKSDADHNQSEARVRLTSLPFYFRGQLMTKSSRDTARQENAVQARAEAETEQQELEDRTARLRAARLAHEKAKP